MKRVTVYIALIVLFFALFVCDILFGSVNIPFGELTRSFSCDSDTVFRTIVMDIRLPKALASVLVGASLSLSGLWMQTLFRNPLAGPYVLGVSSGATLGVAVYIFLFSLLGLSSFYISSWGMALSALVGAASLFLLVIAFSCRLNNSVSLLIAGIMLGSVATAIVSLLQNVSDPDSVKLFVNWTLGSVSGVTWGRLGVMSLLVGCGLFLVPFLIKPMDAMLLGEDYAESLGARVSRTRWMCIVSATLLTGATTAFTGPIGFIGLAVPHLMRGLLNTSSHRLLVPTCLLSGAVLMLLCDILSQLPSSGYVLPINALTALIGAPVVLWIILRGDFYK